MAQLFAKERKRLEKESQILSQTHVYHFHCNYAIPPTIHTISPTYLCDNFIIKLMNDYLTPRRRHSSLFQRMQDQISKISRKLSAAKQHREAHTPIPRQTHTHFRPTESPGLTVRRNNNEVPSTESKELTRKWTGLADKTNLESKRAPIRRLRFSSHRPQEVQNLYEGSYGMWQRQRQELRERQRVRQREKQKEKERLRQEKIVLQQQLQRMKAICEQQSYKLGFLRAENREITSQLETERMDSYREQLYLGKLVEGYSIKVGKYKQILQDEQSLEIDIQDL